MFDLVMNTAEAEDAADRRLSDHLAIGGKTVIYKGELAAFRGTFTGRLTGARMVRLFCLQRRIDFVVALASLANVDLPGVA